MRPNRPNYHRTLGAEPLESRELLAADMGQGAALALEAPSMEEPAIVQCEPQQTCPEGLDTPLQQRDRTSEDSTTGVGRQKRPRDRDSEVDPALTDAALTSMTEETPVVAAASQNGSGGGGQQVPTTSGLTQDQIDEIIFVREEEKLARDVYITLGSMYDVPIFENIAASEQQHMDAVKTLIDKYGLEDPIVDDTVGVFANDTLQQLYDGLVGDDSIDLADFGHEESIVIAGGATSEMAAYEVGAFIEEYDILDIQDALADVEQSDIQNVYENLLKGSRNHLRSFVSTIDANGGDYEPVLMDVTAYNAIIAAEQETGSRNGRGGRRR